MSKKKDEKKGSRAKRHMIAIVLTLIAFVVYDYVMLPAYNIQSTETWFTVCAVLFVFGPFLFAPGACWQQRGGHVHDARHAALFHAGDV